ncbi:MAG: metallophosphoesterase [Oscillospiraceae bacterium]|nr:metallophosphoesterase [Oscillospiraceae bacterium]
MKKNTKKTAIFITSLILGIILGFLGVTYVIFAVNLKDTQFGFLPSDTLNPHRQLKFKEDGTFKIIQVADLQEAFVTSNLTADFLRDIARTEKPDLFVLTGDNIRDVKTNADDESNRMLVRKSIDAFMNVFDMIYLEYGIPVTMVLGNHDSEDNSEYMTRKDHFEWYAFHESFIGAAIPEADEGAVSKNGEHFGSHNLVVYDKNGDEPLFNIWLFDSGDYFPNTEGYANVGFSYSGVQKPQIDWFKRTNAQLDYLPSIAFQHIIVPEVYSKLEETDKGGFSFELFKYDEDGNLVLENGEPVAVKHNVTLPEGFEGELNEYPCPGKFNEGQYTALSEVGNVHALFVGHEHENTFELRFEEETDIVNTPTGGFGSYGKARLRGVRVIELDENALDSYQTSLIFYKDYYSGPRQRARLYLYETLRYWANPLDDLLFRHN